MQHPLIIIGKQVASMVTSPDGDGDLDSAERVDLVEPESGVCNGDDAFDSPIAVASGGGCCGAVPASEALPAGGSGTL